jgi:hypothetical protein
MKFRQYFDFYPPVTSLPDDALDLMYSTMELVDLLYWKPTPSTNVGGAKIDVESGRALMRGWLAVLLFPSSSQTSNQGHPFPDRDYDLASSQTYLMVCIFVLFLPCQSLAAKCCEKRKERHVSKALLLSGHMKTK